MSLIFLGLVIIPYSSVNSVVSKSMADIGN